jgi:hypothetical protein
MMTTTVAGLTTLKRSKLLDDEDVEEIEASMSVCKVRTYA